MGKSNRLTMHNGRKGKNGVFNADHNDRQFSSEYDEHIDVTRSDQNIYASIGDKEKTFKENERDFYIQHFGKGIEEQNKRNIKGGHPERNKTIDDVISNKNTCPEETLYYINSDNCDRTEMNKIMSEFLKWHKEQYPQVKVLNIAGHFDEATDHFHVRRVYIGHNDYGDEVPSQNKAFAEMGIQRPDPSRKEHRWNNAKMTFTEECRKKMFEICKEHGVELIQEPQEKSRSGRTLEEFKYQQEHEKFQQEQEKVVTLEKQNTDLQEQLQSVKQELIDTQGELSVQKNDLATTKEHLSSVKEDYKKATAKIKQYQEISPHLKEAERELNMLQRSLKSISSEIAKMTRAKERFLQKKPKDEIWVHSSFQEEIDDFSRVAPSWIDDIKKMFAKFKKEFTERERRLEDRERKVAEKEASIEPLHEQAAQEKRLYEQYKLGETDFIRQEAENIINQNFDVSTDRSERLEEFCAGVEYSDGTTVLDAFEEQEKQALETMRKKLSSINISR